MNALSDLSNIGKTLEQKLLIQEIKKGANLCPFIIHVIFLLFNRDFFSYNAFFSFKTYKIDTRVPV
jgi:hypothetical protein